MEGAALEEGKYVDLEVDGDIMKLILTASDAQKGLPKLLRVQEGAETARDPGLACTRALQVSFFLIFFCSIFSGLGHSGRWQDALGVLIEVRYDRQKGNHPVDWPPISLLMTCLRCGSWEKIRKQWPVPRGRKQRCRTSSGCQAAAVCQETRAAASEACGVRPLRCVSLVSR